MMLTTLFFQFISFSLISFGGGYTTLAALIDTFVTKEGFWTMDQFGNMLSIAQITPGPISLNTAIFIGYLKGGLIGVTVSTLGLVIPTLFLASLALLFLKKTQKNIWVQGALKGARLAALSMVGYTVCLFLGMSVVNEIAPVMKWINAYQYKLSELIRLNLIGTICFCTTLLLVYKFKCPFTPALLFSAGLGGLIGWLL